MLTSPPVPPSNRSLLLGALCVSAFSFLPLGCHPERSEGSAFRLSPIRALSRNAFNSCSPWPFNIPTFKPSNLQPTPFSCHPVPNPFKIRISAKRACNPCRMRSFKTQDLKPFRMCSYEKTGRGGGGIFQAKGLPVTAAVVGLFTGHGSRATGHGARPYVSTPEPN
jgi:hypothetical protein